MKTIKAQHTPTPWKTGNHKNIFTEDLCFMVAITDVTDKLSEEECQENAEFIVRAVNSHKKLIELLKEAVEFGNEPEDWNMRAEKVIVQAEGK